MFVIYFKDYPECGVYVTSEEEAQETVNASAGILEYRRA